MTDSVDNSAIVPWEDPCLPDFHAGQILARDGDIPRALEKLEQALFTSQKQLSELGAEYQDWINYVEATIAYLRADLATLQSKVFHIKENIEIVHRLVEGLKNFGYPDYSRDF